MEQQPRLSMAKGNSAIQNSIDQLLNLIDRFPSSNLTINEAKAQKINSNTLAKMDPIMGAFGKLKAFCEPFLDEKYQKLFNELPVGAIDNCRTQLDQASGVANQVLSLLLNGNDIEQYTVQGLVKQIDSAHVNLIPYFGFIEFKVSSSLFDYQKANAILQDSKRTAEILESQISQISQKSTEAAANVIVKRNIDEVGAIIRFHYKQSVFWFGAILCSFVFSFYLAIWMNSQFPLFITGGPMFEKLPEHALLPDILVHIFHRIVFISLIFSVPILSVRNYDNHLHNLIVNRQRKAAFVTLTSLLEAPFADADFKKTIVHEAAQTIFSQTTTGFLTKSGGDLQITNQLMEVLLSLAKKS